MIQAHILEMNKLPTKNNLINKSKTGQAFSILTPQKYRKYNQLAIITASPNYLHKQIVSLILTLPYQILVS